MHGGASGAVRTASLLALAAAFFPSDARGADRFAATSPGVVSVVVDVASGRVLSATEPRVVAGAATLPGSILKPLFLAAALEQGAVLPETTFFCRRDLRVAGRDLRCTHPQTNVAFDAEQGLAYSCNTYFAEMARRMSPNALLDVAGHYGLGRLPRLFAKENAGFVAAPHGEEDRELFVLGLGGLEVTAAQVAVAYRRLWLEMHGGETQRVLRPVMSGLRDSVEYGMAHNAATPGIEVMGKTGTAAERGQFRTHGWFAGAAHVGGREVIVVVYLPVGNGGDAAAAARRLLLTYERGPSR
jgi:cell division protein FtsI/penicillin-binding protein 2